MVSNELKSHALPPEFPERIRELLALPRPLQIENHPVQRMWEAFRSCFPGFELVELDEVLERSVSHFPADQMRRVAYEVDDRRVLRTDLSAGLVDLWLARDGGPCQLIAVGRTFRKGSAKTSEECAEAFHQAEVLWVEEGLDEKVCLDTAKRVVAAVLGNVETRMSPVHTEGPGIRARDWEGRWRGDWLEFGVSGMHCSELIKRAGIDPGRFGAICLAFGLERCAMIHDDIDDIRKLWQPPYVPH